eukprot:scaffold3928_cov99-Skeletonema_dohrnii-CCMP3373.AAC.11
MSPTSHDQKKRQASGDNETEQRVKQKTARDTSDASSSAALQQSSNDDVISISSTESPTKSVSNTNTFSSDYPRYDGKHLEENFSYFQPACDVHNTTAVIAGRPSAKKNPNISVYSTTNWEVTQVLSLRGVSRAESIAISGDLMVVGVTTAESQQQEVHIYKKVKEQFKRVDIMAAPEGFPNFASTISLDGNVMVVKQIEREQRGCAQFTFSESSMTRRGRTRSLCNKKCVGPASENTVVQYDDSKKDKVWRCIDRIFPGRVYVDEDEDTHSRETKCDARILRIVMTDDSGSLLVGFGVKLPTERDYTASHGALHYYTLNDEGEYVLKQAVKLAGKHIWNGSVVGIAVDGETMILSVQEPWERSVAVKYTLVCGVWKEERVISRERAIGSNLKLLGNKFIATYGDNAEFYTLDEEAFI